MHTDADVGHCVQRVADLWVLELPRL